MVMILTLKTFNQFMILSQESPFNTCVASSIILDMFVHKLIVSQLSCELVDRLDSG